MKPVIFLIALLLLATAVTAQDATHIWFSDNKKVDGNNVITVNVHTADNNNNADWDGGKFSLTSAHVLRVNRIDWEKVCDITRSHYECVEAGRTILQWYNYVANEQDYFTFDVQYEDNGVLILEETGGMECGAYSTSARTSSFSGFPDGSGGLPCSAEKTFLSGFQVSELGGFPVRVQLERAVENQGTVFEEQNPYLYYIVLGSVFAVTMLYLVARRLPR